MTKIIPVILAGGAGTRLWPLSRDDKPKQFHNLSGEGTLLEETIKRMLPLEPEMCVLVTSGKYEDASKSELDKIGIKGIVLAEPFPRNTAAAVLYSITYLSKKLQNDVIMIILPADHYIKDRIMFTCVLEKAIQQAKLDKIVSIGIKPQYPETGYGYIKSSQQAGEILDVERFVEKPDLDKAKEYVLDGNYFWNSGIFVWKLSKIESCFKELMPAHYAAFEELRSLTHDQLESNSEYVWEMKKNAFACLESISIDYGIMENAENRVVIPGEFGWADLGTWNAIDDILTADADMNRTPDADEVIFMKSNNCTAFPENKRITIVGLSNIVVVESGNDILVMDKNSSQDVRQVVEIIKKKNDL